MNYILFDGAERNNLLPFTYTRPVAEIRIGILTIREKWEITLSEKFSHLTQDYLSEKFPTHVEAENILINGSVLPNEFIIDVIINLKQDEKLVYDNTVIAIGASQSEIEDNTFLSTAKKNLNLQHPAFNIKNTWDIFHLNDYALRADFDLITAGRKSQHIYAPNQLIGFENIFIEEGAKVYASILNATAGPIYIGKNAEVMEGNLIRGPFSLGENSTLKMGSKIYGATTIGNDCKVGGELNNSVIFGFSNKAHEGYLGNSVIGEWCNLGADTNTSNLKNNYSNVKVWSFAEGKYIDTGLQFCGLAMGDHSKCSINTQFNTGTVAGVCANIFGEGFPPKNIANFSWGGAKGFEKFELDKAIEIAGRVYTRRNMTFDETEQRIFEYLYKHL
ncbi:MAG: GlmU family protein [Bacteroidia bacterium]